MIFRLGTSGLDGKNRILDTPLLCPLFLVSAGDRTLEFLGGIEPLYDSPEDILVRITRCQSKSDTPSIARNYSSDLEKLYANS